MRLPLLTEALFLFVFEWTSPFQTFLYAHPNTAKTVETGSVKCSAASESYNYWLPNSHCGTEKRGEKDTIQLLFAHPNVLFTISLPVFELITTLTSKTHLLE